MRPTGNQPSATEKNMMASRHCQNVGMAYMTMLTSVLAESNVLPRRQPAITPFDHADDGGQQRAQAAEDDRRPDARGDDLRHRHLEGERVAEPEARRVGPVVDELLPHGLVQVECRFLLLQRGDRDLALGQQEPRRVARHDAKQDEIERRDEDDRQQRVGDLADEVGALVHGCTGLRSALAAPGLRRSPRSARGRQPHRLAPPSPHMEPRHLAGRHLRGCSRKDAGDRQVTAAPPLSNQ